MAKALSGDSLRIFLHISRQSSVDVCTKFRQITSSQTFLHPSRTAPAIPCLPVATKQHCKLCTSGVGGSKLLSNARLLLAVKPSLSQTLLHTSPISHGLEEFFEDKKNLGEDKVKSGREWKVEELRLKDNVTLHKLWYVLLKERNMLMTMEEEAERLKVFMPSPDRLDKVVESMQNLKQVVKERDEALNLLNTGQRELHPGRWQYTPFGFKRFVRPKEYILPQHMNKYAATKRKKYGRYMLPFIREWMEQELRKRRRLAASERKKIQKLRERYPDSDYWKED
ncbi:large ribosomal subunit protein uL29m-like [Amphiura filiformis]|uniref:large ribosomal subunit protein uL29m-like n=1 Tax=Amphiura filiformis TaxID=82378 RepID=UPI003B21FF0E